MRDKNIKIFFLGGKWTNSNFLVKFILILIEITGILIDIIFLVKSTF